MGLGLGAVAVFVLVGLAFVAAKGFVFVAAVDFVAPGELASLVGVGIEGFGARAVAAGVELGCGCGHGFLSGCGLRSLVQ